MPIHHSPCKNALRVWSAGLVSTGLAFLTLAGCTTVPQSSEAGVAALETPGPVLKSDYYGTQPNVIVILTDDQGYDDVSFNGSNEIPTPNINRIAFEGARFDRGYVSFPVCGPSRAGLLTGRYQSRFGFDLNPSENPDDPNAGLPLSEDTMATVLSQAGYTSAIIGKWHMGNHPKFHPLERGFDEFYGFTNGGHNYYADQYRDIDVQTVATSAALYQTRLIRGRESIDASGYLTDILSDEAVDFVERHKDGPFFLYLSYNAPHAPVQAPPRYTDRFPHIEDETRRTYAGMIAAVDDGVGRLLDTLEANGIDDNTMIFFLSDNGGPLERAKNGSRNAPLRGGKGNIFEGGVRVPFAIRWPDAVPGGIDYPNAVSSLDILATAAAAAGIDTQVRNPLDGADLVPFLNEEGFETAPHDMLFWRYRDAQTETFPRRGALSGDNKMVVRQRNEMLFDLETDTGEQTDLSQRDPKTLDELEQAYKAWDESMGELSISIFNQWPVRKNTQAD